MNVLGVSPKTSRAPSASRFEWLLVERTFTNNSNIASDSPACSVVFSDFFNKTPPFPSLVGFVDFGFAVFIIISVFGGVVLGWNGHFASAYAALSTAVFVVVLAGAAGSDFDIARTQQCLVFCCEWL